MFKRFAKRVTRAVYHRLPFASKLYQWMLHNSPESGVMFFIMHVQSRLLKSLVSKQTESTVLLIIRLENELDEPDVVNRLKTTLDSLAAQYHERLHVLIIADTEDSLKHDLESLMESYSGLSISVSSPGQSVSDELYDFVGEMYVGDTLHELAIHTMLCRSVDSTQLIYCDALYGSTRFNHKAYFKQGYSKELARSQFYFGALALYRFSNFTSVDAWIEMPSHYQRYLFLEQQFDCNEVEWVQHIPYLLYSHSGTLTNTGYSCLSDRAALQERLGVPVVTGLIENSLTVKWPMPEPAPLVSIVIPTRNRWELVKQCIDSVYQLTEYCNFEVVLIDNQSDEQQSLDYFSALVSLSKVRLIQYNKPFNYSAINNFAVQHAKGEYLVLMNNDIEIISTEWLTEIVRQLARPEIGCVGAKLYYPNNTIQHAGVIVGLGRCAGHSQKHFQRTEHGYMNRLMLTQNYQAVTAALLGIRKSVFLEVGGLNETDLTVAFNDVDLCLKVQKAGYENLWSPYIEAYHHESVSRGNDMAPEHYERFQSEVAYMQKTWQLDTIRDKYYNPWLTIAKEDFSLDHTSLLDKDKPL